MLSCPFYGVPPDRPDRPRRRRCRHRPGPVRGRVFAPRAWTASRHGRNCPSGRAAGRARRACRPAAEFDGFRHGYAGTIYKSQGKTLDHTYLLHTHHWRAAASYVALTRQRDSAQVFPATMARVPAFSSGRSRGREPLVCLTAPISLEMRSLLPEPKPEHDRHYEERERDYGPYQKEGEFA